jgi:integrase
MRVSIRRRRNIARLWALTGCRRDEIAGLNWAEVDLDSGLLKLADGKTGKSIRPLGMAAIAILSSLARQEASEFVFPAERGDGHYQGTKGVWSKAIKKAGLPGITPHTLRHTMGSTAVSTGEALALTGAILGQSKVHGHLCARAERPVQAGRQQSEQEDCGRSCRKSVRERTMEARHVAQK